MADDLASKDVVHTRTQVVRHEGIPQQVGIHPFSDAGVLSDIFEQVPVRSSLPNARYP